MKCPYCGSDMGPLPAEAIRASMRGPKMLEIFDLIMASGDRGISLGNIVTQIYPPDTSTDKFNTLKVTMIRLKERVKKFGWIIESGTAQDSTTERVYRLRRDEHVHD